MSRKKTTTVRRRTGRTTVMLEIELPELSDEAAAAVADVLVQLFHRFEAAYYVQILSHHADLAVTLNSSAVTRAQPPDDPQLF